MPYDDEGTDCSAAAASQGMPRIPCISILIKGTPMPFKLPEARKRQERILP